MIIEKLLKSIIKNKPTKNVENIVITIEHF